MDGRIRWFLLPFICIWRTYNSVYFLPYVYAPHMKFFTSFHIIVYSMPNVIYFFTYVCSQQFRWCLLSLIYVCTLRDRILGFFYKNFQNMSKFLSSIKDAEFILRDLYAVFSLWHINNTVITGVTVTGVYRLRFKEGLFESISATVFLIMTVFTSW